MAPLQLIKKISILGLFVSSFAMGSPTYLCREVKVESQNLVDSSEVIELCFLKDSTYFISKNCSDLKCNFAKQLKKIEAITSSRERPGAAMCDLLHGVIEEVKIESEKSNVKRCLFVKEKVSISLNLLESWDGKKFSGPSDPIEM